MCLPAGVTEECTGLFYVVIIWVNADVISGKLN